MTNNEHLEQFRKDTLSGLTLPQKQLSSKYFYDEEGSQIFQDIMKMPEYYLTDCEYEIFNEQGSNILKAFANGSDMFQLIELGSGDGLKTRVLIKKFLKRDASFSYHPVDISHSALLELQQSLKLEFPSLKIDERNGDYFDVLGEFKPNAKVPKVILFLGSNIGNYTHKESVQFFKMIRRFMGKKDKLFVGMDLKKSPRVIIDAYDDPHRHTARFNLNLLKRINNELGGEFDLKKFVHHEVYDPITGTAKSYLVSLEKQEVKIDGISRSIKFKAFETIYTEQSQKYDIEMIEDIAFESGFEVKTNFFDERSYFVNSLWQPIKR